MGCPTAMFNGKPRVGNSREFPFPGKRAGNFRTSGIPEFREFPEVREIPGKIPGKFPYLGKFPRYRNFQRHGNFPWLGNFPYLGKFPNHGKFPNRGKFLGNGKFPGIPVREIPGREISQASQEGGNGNFPLNITALCLASW